MFWNAKKRLQAKILEAIQSLETRTESLRLAIKNELPKLEKQYCANRAAIHREFMAERLKEIEERVFTDKNRYNVYGNDLESDLFNVATALYEERAKDLALSIMSKINSESQKTRQKIVSLFYRMYFVIQLEEIEVSTYDIIAMEVRKHPTIKNIKLDNSWFSAEIVDVLETLARELVKLHRVPCYFVTTKTEKAAQRILDFESHMATIRAIENGEDPICLSLKEERRKYAVLKDKLQHYIKQYGEDSEFVKDLRIKVKIAKMHKSSYVDFPDF